MIKRKTKIVATLGPATDTPERIKELIAAGVDVFRLNLSHGTRADHKRRIDTVRDVSAGFMRQVAILMDIQGPKIRIGKVQEGGVLLKEGSVITITNEDMIGNEEVVPTTYRGLPEDLSAGDRVLIDDGLLELKVDSVSGSEVRCIVVYGGLLKDHKGINLPGVDVSAPAFTEKDRGDVDFGVGEEVDFFALSFVRTVGDIKQLRDYLEGRGSRTPILSKIETDTAIKNLDGIVTNSDGVMVARGDLGVELSAEDVPILQKQIIEMARKAGKPVITATQMLDSMMVSPRPTRAEASDVANAVFDGTDAVMLSGETASGKYPVKSVEMMGRIIDKAEGVVVKKQEFIRRNMETRSSVTEAVAFAALAAAGEISAKAIVVFTLSGSTAYLISRLRPKATIICFTPSEVTGKKLALYWGLSSFFIQFGSVGDELISQGESRLLELGLVKKGDHIVMVSGSSSGISGATNMMRITTCSGLTA
ncbi:Pyruvate kinase [hydrothermal vent metagenome]|uniref:pyruvate kinase n=1 Tax=hydrothermal vent metagenome TaxID=652676 RepID=A0A3B0V3A9_9ZZZZ